MVTFFITTLLPVYNDHFSNKKAKKKKKDCSSHPDAFYISLIQLGWIEHHCVCLSGRFVQVWVQQSYNQKWEKKKEKKPTPTPGWKRWFWSASKQTLLQFVLCVRTWCKLNLQKALCVFLDSASSVGSCGRCGMRKRFLVTASTTCQRE